MKVFMKAATVACIIALLGGGIATARTLITGSQVKDSSLTGRDVKNGSLTPADFSGSVTGPQGAPGAPGQRGLPGATGATGATGAAGVASIAQVTGPSVTVLPGNVGGAQAYCPAGTSVVGTGFYADIGNIGFAKAFGGFVGIGVINDKSIAISIHAQALCASAGATAAATTAAARTSARPDTSEFDSAVSALRAR